MDIAAEIATNADQPDAGKAGVVCSHPTARVIRLYVSSRVDATEVRARIASDPSERGRVSGLYEITGGWAFTLCGECAEH